MPRLFILNDGNVYEIFHPFTEDNGLISWLVGIPKNVDKLQVIVQCLGGIFVTNDFSTLDKQCRENKSNYCLVNLDDLGINFYHGD